MRLPRLLSNGLLSVSVSLAALVLLAVYPLSGHGPPVGLDGQHHFYRFAALDWHVRHGDLYPRWFSDIYYGYGGPLLNFYAPLSYYIPVALRFVAGSAPTAFLVGFALSAAAAVVGMYAWANSQFASPIAGLTAAAAYGSAPYLYWTLLGRASLPEAWAMAIAPWVFWSALRFLRRPGRSSRILLTLSFAAFLLSHNLSALLLTPVLLLYCLTLAAALEPRPGWRRLGWLGVSLLQAVAIGAFFLLPFAAESSYVQLERAGGIDYRDNFLAPGRLLSPPTPFDPYHVVHDYPPSLAWPVLGLAALGVGYRLIKRPHARDGRTGPIIANAAMVLVLALLTQPLSRPVWEALPFSDLIQFLWRLVAPMTLLAAWLAGAGAMVLLRARAGRWLAPAAALSFFLFAISWTYFDPYDPFPQAPKPSDIVRHEIAHPYYAGLTSYQEFLPVWAVDLPSPDALAARYQDSELPSRLRALPEGVRVSSETVGVISTEIAYESPRPFTAEFAILYFPGWTAALDGQRVGIREPDTHGTIAVEVPSGRHTLRLSLEPTPLQQAGSWISVMALLLIFLPFPMSRSATGEPPAQAGAAHPVLWQWAALFLGMLLLRVAVLDRYENIYWHTDFDNIQRPLSVNFDDQLKLIGVALPQGETFGSGQEMKVTLYWQAVQPLETSYSTRVHLVDAYGSRFGQSDSYYPAGEPTVSWRVDRYARDDHRLSTLPGTPPGEYRLLAGVYTVRGDGSTASLSYRQDAAPSGVEVEIGRVTVTRGAPQPPGPLHLVEGFVNADRVTAGDQLPVELLWHSGGVPLPSLSARLTLTPGGDRGEWSIDFSPARPDYGTGQWGLNELVRYSTTVVLPPDLPAGPVHLQIALVSPEGARFTEAYELGLIHVAVPDRSFAIPEMTRIADHDFNGAIRLLGYDVTPDSLTLYWQSLRVVTTPLTVFIHRFNENGEFVAGYDGPPPRITTSWVTGEVLADRRSIPVGDRFEVGWYDPASGERFGEPFVVGP